ncbi:MAG: LytR family transcriptional regulator, partial [Actinobacteria bacterium]
SKLQVPSLLGSIKHNVEVGRAGGSGVDLSTMLNYALFFHGLPGGHFVQVKIQGLEGQSDLTTATQNVTNAVQQFMNPDPEAPQKANAAALDEKYKSKAHGINPKSIFITVLNGNGFTGSAASAGTQLRDRNYQILQPPAALRADSPDGWNHARTRVFYDVAKKNAKQAATQVSKLFADASTGPLTPKFQPYANGAALVVVVGKSYQGSLIGSTPSAPPPKHQPPHTFSNPGASLSLMRSIRRKLPFRVEYPSVIERNSRVDPEPPNPRVYTVQGHKMARLVFTNGVNGEYWGIQEMNWGGAPALSEKNFVRHFGRRTFEFFYSGSNLHMVVLKENRATYWVVNTLDDALSPETMIAIARGLRPLR